MRKVGAGCGHSRGGHRLGAQQEQEQEQEQGLGLGLPRGVARAAGREPVSQKFKAWVTGPRPR